MTTASTERRRPGERITFYTILGLTSDADPDAIRDAYRRLARVFHPDTGGDVHSMSLINKAWAELGDPERRAAYDRRLGIAHEVRITAEPPLEPPPEPIADSPLTTRIMTGTGTVLEFGRYEGWTIDQLAKHDPEYLLWLERTPIGRPYQAEINDALADRH